MFIVLVQEINILKFKPELVAGLGMHEYRAFKSASSCRIFERRNLFNNYSEILKVRFKQQNKCFLKVMVDITPKGVFMVLDLYKHPAADYGKVTAHAGSVPKATLQVVPTSLCPDTALKVLPRMRHSRCTNI